MKPDKVPAELLKFPIDEYLDYNPYLENELALRKVQIVKVRYHSTCEMGYFVHPPKTIMWQEKGVEDGVFVSTYLCLGHVTVGIDFENGGHHDPYSLSCQQAGVFIPEEEEEEE